MPRFVILEHDHPVLHWDLMLEWGETLRTWRLAAPPELGKAVAAEPSFDHRLIYLDYEGPISGNRGNVRRWEAGSYRLLLKDSDRIELLLWSGQLNGKASLQRESEQGWVFAIGLAEPRAT
ncbi:MAG: hypothetical protein K8T89_23720 [Planctomycetes bacterium]|nr:hypothetical protein [Planctomycetota bacterium]